MRGCRVARHILMGISAPLQASHLSRLGAIAATPLTLSLVYASPQDLWCSTRYRGSGPAVTPDRHHHGSANAGHGGRASLFPYLALMRAASAAQSLAPVLAISLGGLRIKNETIA